MNENCESVIINGVKFVPEQSKNISDNYVIIRARDAGVFAGELERKDKNEVTLKNARRIWRWSGAASISQMAMDGVSHPEQCKFPCEVTSLIILGVIEIIPCTQTATKSIKSVPIWKS